jgi:predicted Zn-dependent protease
MTDAKSAEVCGASLARTKAVCLLAAILLAACAPVRRPNSPTKANETLNEVETNKLIREGNGLSADEAKDLENLVAKEPADFENRIRLLGYYFRSQRDNLGDAKLRWKHALWVIEHEPATPVAGDPYVGLDPVLEADEYEEGKRLWLKHTAASDAKAAVLGNAANYFIVYEPETAERLLLRAEEQEPKNTKWNDRLGQLYMLRRARQKDLAQAAALAGKALAQYELALAGASTSERPALVVNAAKAAIEAGEVDKARRFGKELVDNPGPPNVWYHGNSIHHGNLILGRVALRADDVAEAERRLLLAGKTPGSPQLKSFGPNMALAKELLERGRKDAVLQYFELCAAFWESHRDQLETWKKEVTSGKVPDFGANLDY